MRGPAATGTELVAPTPGGRVFEQAVRAGLGDAAPRGRVRLDAIARWLQDVAHADVEDAGLDGVAVWVVRRARLQVLRFPRLAERLRVRTFCSGVGRMWAERRTTVLAGDEALVEAAALWVHLDPRSGRPVPFRDEEIAAYEASANGRVIKARLRHPPPGADAVRGTWPFRATDLDIAGHVNNAAYWGPLEAKLIAGPEPERLDAELEFRTPAQPGEVAVLREAGRMWIAAPAGAEVYASLVLREQP